MMWWNWTYHTPSFILSVCFSQCFFFIKCHGNVLQIKREIKVTFCFGLFFFFFLQPWLAWFVARHSTCYSNFSWAWLNLNSLTGNKRLRGTIREQLLHIDKNFLKCNSYWINEIYTSQNIKMFWSLSFLSVWDPASFLLCQEFASLQQPM